MYNFILGIYNYVCSYLPRAEYTGRYIEPGIVGFIYLNRNKRRPQTRVLYIYVGKM